eukprot:Trichotokara_eunicae@DN5659_c0_g1_i2.p1
MMLRALDLGADLVMNSTTKFFDGHNVTFGGVIISSTAELDEKIRFHRNVFGSIMTAQTAFYQMQFAKTLPCRFLAQCKSAKELAEIISNHAAVEWVNYPGLDSFPQRELSKKQHKNDLGGTMIAFEVKGGSEKGKKLMNSIKSPWTLAENLGVTESIITCPAVFTHSNMLKEDRLKVGITDGLVRASVGLEDVSDLKKSIQEALDNLLEM